MVTSHQAAIKMFTESVPLSLKIKTSLLLTVLEIEEDKVKIYKFVYDVKGLIYDMKYFMTNFQSSSVKNVVEVNKVIEGF